MILISIDQSKERELRRAFARVQEITGRSCVQSVTYAAIQMCTAASSHAKPSPKKRPVRRNPEWNEKSGARWLEYLRKENKKIPEKYAEMLLKFRPFQIEKRKQPDWKIKYIPVWQKDDRRVKIGRSGLARRAFQVAGKICGSMIHERSQKIKHNLAEVTRLVTPRNVFFRVIVFLNYINKAFPKIKIVAAEKGIARLNAIMDYHIKRNMR